MVNRGSTLKMSLLNKFVQEVTNGVMMYENKAFALTSRCFERAASVFADVANRNHELLPILILHVQGSQETGAVEMCSALQKYMSEVTHLQSSLGYFSNGQSVLQFDGFYWIIGLTTELNQNTTPVSFD